MNDMSCGVGLTSWSVWPHNLLRMYLGQITELRFLLFSSTHWELHVLHRMAYVSNKIITLKALRTASSRQ